VTFNTSVTSVLMLQITIMVNYACVRHVDVTLFYICVRFLDLTVYCTTYVIGGIEPILRNIDYHSMVVF